MDGIERLQDYLVVLEEETKHKGYYYRVSDALTIMICGMLCNLQSIADIYDWAQSEPVQDFMFREFHIYKIPSRAQFYNLIGCIKYERFQVVFIAWVEAVVQNGDELRTIAIDGKMICSTEKRAAEGQEVHILSAVISESKLILGSMPCKKKDHRTASIQRIDKNIEYQWSNNCCRRTSLSKEIC